MSRRRRTPIIFFFNDTATTEIYTLSLHDALPISRDLAGDARAAGRRSGQRAGARGCRRGHRRSEEHTSELQSRSDLVCRLLLEKKKRPQHARLRVSSWRPSALRYKTS